MKSKYFAMSVIAYAVIASNNVVHAAESDKRLDELEKRLNELEIKVQQKDKKIAELEQQTQVTAHIADQAAAVAISSALFADFKERSSHRFSVPDKSIRLTNSDTTLQIGGQIWLDAIYNNGEMTNRGGFQPSSIAYEDNVTKDNTLLNVGQSKLSIKSHTPTRFGAMKTRFEFDLFQDDGNADFNLNHLWGEMGNWGAGQTFSGFMDINAFPNIIDYWGPNGVVFARQPQIRYTHHTQSNNKLIVTLERSDSDLANPNFIAGNTVNFSEKNDFADLTMGYTNHIDAGYFKVAMILRSIGYETNNTDDTVIGLGLNVTGNYSFNSQNTLKYQITSGKGIGRYVNDACCSYYADETGGVDAGLNGNGDLEAIGITSGFIYLDHSWSDDYTSSFGFSYVDVSNLDTQRDKSLNNSLYASSNFIWNPTEMSRVGVELLYGEVESFAGDKADDVRLQASFGFRY